MKFKVIKNSISPEKWNQSDIWTQVQWQHVLQFQSALLKDMKYAQDSMAYTWSLQTYIMVKFVIYI